MKADLLLCLCPCRGLCCGPTCWRWVLQGSEEEEEEEEAGPSCRKKRGRASAAGGKKKKKAAVGFSFEDEPGGTAGLGSVPLQREAVCHCVP